MTIWHALASFFVQKNSPSSLSNVKSCLCSFVTKKEPSELRYPPPKKNTEKKKETQSFHLWQSRYQQSCLLIFIFMPSHEFFHKLSSP